MYDDEFELTFNLSDEDPAPVEVPKAPAEEAEPEKPEPPTPAPDEEPTIVVPELGRKPAAEPDPTKAADGPNPPPVPDPPQPPQPHAVPRLHGSGCAGSGRRPRIARCAGSAAAAGTGGGAVGADLRRRPGHRCGGGTSLL